MARRIILSLLTGVLLTGLGCAQARYVEKGNGEGIVAVPSNSDYWPTRNRTKALALIEEHVGQDYEIVQEGKVATVPPNEPLMHDYHTFDPREDPTVPVTEYQIRYRERERYRTYRLGKSWKYNQSESKHLTPVRIHGGIL